MKRGAHVARLVLLTAAYYALGRLGLSLAHVHPSVSSVWPPSGLAVAVLLLFGSSLWPGVLAGAFLLNLGMSGSLAASAAIGVGNTVEALLGATLARRYARGTQAFDRVRDFAAFLVLTALLSTAVAATVGSAALVLSGLALGSRLGSLWLHWWIGDSAGVILLAPALVLWAERSPLPEPGRRAEAALVLLSLLVTALIVFSGASPFGAGHPPDAFLCIPVVCWAALRFGPQGSATVTLLLAAMATWGTIRGYGPFAEGPSELVFLPEYLATIGVVGIALGAILAERREAERALRREQELLTRIFDTIPVMITLYDPETRVVRLNREFERRTGWSSEAVAGASLMERCYPDPAYRETVRRFMESGEGWMDVDMRVRDGATLATSWANIRLSDDTQVGIGLDITERKHTEQALRDADRRKDEFLATLSHELRSPLNAVLNWVHLLRRGALDEAKAANALDVIERNTRRQVKLVDDLLDVSRITTGKLKVEKTLVDLAWVVDSAVEDVRSAALGKNLSVRATIERRPLHVLGDATRLQQVVGNLLSNAVKFTPVGGRIHVLVREVEREAVVSVRDTGEGIPPALIEKIFDRFEQADSSLTRKHEGLGLGLTIARSLVALHGGRIEAWSDGEGKGATFTVSLPLARSVPLPAASPEGSGGNADGLRGLRVLVVDDDPDGLEASVGVLSAAGAEVVAASSVAEALARFAEVPPDVVLTDLAMPGRDGFALLRAVRAGETGGEKRTPVIALTAFAAVDDQVRARREGFDRHVGKPVSPPELVDAVRACLRST